MALVECVYCHARISERAETCPKCGLDRHIVCEDCQTALPPVHQGACPECGNPTPGAGVTLFNAPIVLESVPYPEQIEEHAEARYQELLEQDNRYLSFRLLVGIVLGLFSGWWLTAGFVKHGFLEFLPIMVIIAAIGMAYPRFFAVVTVIGMIAKLYLAVIE